MGRHWWLGRYQGIFQDGKSRTPFAGNSDGWRKLKSNGGATCRCGVVNLNTHTMKDKITHHHHGVSPFTVFVGCVAIAMLFFFGCRPAHAQSVTNIVNQIPSVSSLTSVTNLLTSLTPTAAVAKQYKFDARIGYGINLNSQQPIAALAVSYQIAPALAIGGVVSRDSTGICAGGVTLGINGSVKVFGEEVDLFAGDGIAYDFHYRDPANYLFTGAEVPFHVGGTRIAPGISLANTSTRAGADLLLGVSVEF